MHMTQKKAGSPCSGLNAGSYFFSQDEGMTESSVETLEKAIVPPSLGLSRQEHWNGLPFPSPMHESEKWKWSCSVVSDYSQPHGLRPTRLLRPRDFPGKRTGVGCHCLLQLFYEIRPKMTSQISVASFLLCIWK